MVAMVRDLGLFFWVAFRAVALIARTQTEMSNINQSSGGPTAILNKCKEINDGISQLRSKREGQLVAAQNALLDSSTGKEDQASRQGLDYIEDDINTAFRYLRDQFKRVKETPGSGDPRVQGQVENTSRNLRREIEQYQRAQSDFRKRLEEQVRRRYEIANPEATPEELEQGVQNVLLGQEQSFVVCCGVRSGLLQSDSLMFFLFFSLPSIGSRCSYSPSQRCSSGYPAAFCRHPQDRAGYDRTQQPVPRGR